MHLVGRYLGSLLLFQPVLSCILHLAASFLPRGFRIVQAELPGTMEVAGND